MKNKKLYTIFLVILLLALISMPVGFYLYNSYIPEYNMKSTAIDFLDEIVEGNYKNAAEYLGEFESDIELKNDRNVDKEKFVNAMEKLEQEGFKITGYNIDSLEIGTDDFCIMGVNINEMNIENNGEAETVVLYLVNADNDCPPSEYAFSSFDVSPSNPEEQETKLTLDLQTALNSF